MVFCDILFFVTRISWWSCFYDAILNSSKYEFWTDLVLCFDEVYFCFPGRIFDELNSCLICFRHDSLQYWWKYLSRAIPEVPGSLFPAVSPGLMLWAVCSENRRAESPLWALQSLSRSNWLTFSSFSAIKHLCFEIERSSSGIKIMWCWEIQSLLVSILHPKIFRATSSRLMGSAKRQRRREFVQQVLP